VARRIDENDSSSHQIAKASGPEDRCNAGGRHVQPSVNVMARINYMRNNMRVDMMV
jgi:hypothetical protein